MNKDFEIIAAGKIQWERSSLAMIFVSASSNVMVSSEWAAPNTFMPGFDLEEVGHLKYGRELHFWDFEKRQPIESFILVRMGSYLWK